MKNLGLVVGIVGIGCAAQAVTLESARESPVAADVDVLVVGGTAAGVSAAAAAAESGASVFLTDECPFLGEDMASTLELECAGGPEATELERRLRKGSADCVPYTYDYERQFRYFGGWEYFNDGHDKLSTAGLPKTVRDTVLFTNEASVACTLLTPGDIASVEVMVVENVDRTRPGCKSVDHRGAIPPGKAPGPLTGRVSLTLLDGPAKGRTIVLERVGVAPFASEDLNPRGVDAPKSATKGYQSPQQVVIYRASVDANVHEARVLIAPAEDACCQLVSRIHFRPGATVHTDDNPSPLKVKRTFDEILFENGVACLTGSPVTDLLRDGNGVLAGVVIANRSGRQAVKAKSVVDATRQGLLSRLGRPVDGLGKAAKFSRVVVSGGRPEAAGMDVVQIPGGAYIDHARATSNYRGFEHCAVTGRLWRCTFDLPMADGSYASFAAAEWAARELTWNPTIFDAADQLRLLTPVRVAPAREALWTVTADAPLGARIRRGAETGRAAAAAARKRGALAAVAVEAEAASGKADGDVCELLGGIRPYDRFRPALGSVKSPARELPVLGEYDVVVVGGGTAGVPAAIAAGRSGAKTLLVEYLYTLGGVSTDGMIVGYYDGNHCGFQNEYKNVLRETMAVVASHRIERTFHRMLDAAHVTVWHGGFGAGAYVRDGQVLGVVVATPMGRGVVRAKCVVDGTGNADVAAAAGAHTTFIGAKELLLQSAGQAPHRLGRGCINTDFGYVNDADAWDMWLFGVRSRAGAPDPWDVQQLVDSRERRRIVPDLTVEGWDVVYKRPFPDTVNRSKSKQDSHGLLQDEYGTVAEVDGISSRYVNLPLRAYLPKGVGRLAVIGLGKGVARDVVPMTRMRADMTNEGYALGLCAAEAAKEADGDFRRIDVKKIQKELVRIGNLPDEVLSWKEDPELTDEQLATVVAGVGDGYRGSGYVMRYPARSLPFLRQGYAKATKPAEKQAYAILLGLLGDATGLETLLALASERQPFARLRKGVSYCGEGYDKVGLALALARTKSPEALAPLVRWLKVVGKEGLAYKAVRPVALGLETLGDAKAAPVLAEMLKRPGVGGWSRREVSELVPLGGYGVGPEMNLCLRELALARALVACGDHEGLGRRTLEAYAKDPRGTLAEHANAVLSGAR